MSASTRTRWSDVGALTSAGTVAATILCCLPFATGIIGASVAAVGARFVPFQPYLIGVSVVLLAYSFYQAYRRDATCSADGCDLPTSAHRRRITHDGHGQQADEQQAYTLADDATFWQLESRLREVVLFSEDARLVNSYAVVFPSNQRLGRRLCCMADAWGWS